MIKAGPVSYKHLDVYKRQVNTNISCELTGPTGNGIQSIQLTQGNHTPGSTDIYTVTMTDGSKYNIAVYNLSLIHI